MDVKYIPADWEKMKSGLGDLIGLGRWGKGMIDDLKDITDNLEDAKSDIAKYDSDGVVSFSHIDREQNYQSLFDDFNVLHTFSGKVGDIVDRTIDQPFYEDIDTFVETMRDATISKYTTENRIGATEEQTIYYGQGMQETRKVPKAEVSLDDLLSGDNYYAEQLKIEYDMWKAEHPDQDFSQEDYRMAAVNMRAFEYDSIKDQQYNKEFWVNIAALVVIVGAAIVCPPAGLALGAAYGGMEISTAITGKDWISGRELDTGERWFRGALAPLDIVPGVAGIKKFSSGVRVANQAADLGQFGLKTGVKTSVQKQLSHVGDMVVAAGKQTEARLRNAGRVVKDKLVNDTIDLTKVTDKAVTVIKPREVVEVAGIGKMFMKAENTHSIEKWAKSKFGKTDGVNVGGVRNANDLEKFAYNMIDNPGPLSKLRGNPAGNFYGGKYNVEVLKDDLILYRAGEAGGLTMLGKEKNALGQWFTREPAESAIKVRIDTAVKPQWIDPKTGILTGTSPINATYKIKIPKGTTIYEGPVGNQGGVYTGGMDYNQIFISEPWKIKGIEVLKEIPLK
ncbi:hypothetical protein GMD78_04140 [Ornithinibacillus sp. L9]|uniref:Pre-toxin TG domain-containing protein n=1 Tax=Ornithinibacillus caprae TaxID=2678566 RepID=A0A6N8FDJ5_9BACI|nr:pre-toxin TG domain-containing protein [Ornithinibacillus caprae]MUK87590.1 hypothetical protein [Ornithinibacillus caprae]